MSLPRFVAVPPEPSWDIKQAAVFDLAGPPIKGFKARSMVAVCFCHDVETAELIALALNREMMQ